MLRTLQVITVLVFVAVMYAVHQGAYAFSAAMGGRFSWGFVAGMVFTALVVLFLNWVEKKLPSDRRSQ